MQKLSLTKIFFLAIGIIALAHLGHILEAFGQVYNWFAYSLEPIRYFPEGAQVTIAFLLLLLIAMFVFKTINK